MAKKQVKVNPVGRPPEYKAPEDTAIGHQVSLTPKEKAKIIKLYGSLTKALKSLIK